jgi:Wiskott-Aldrich syndrome protein
MGAAAILTDKASNSHYLKVVDLSSKSVNFTQELYNNFEYHKAREFFHTFEAEEEVVGLSFADESDAREFFAKVCECARTPPSRMMGGAFGSSPSSPTGSFTPGSPTGTFVRETPASAPISSAPSSRNSVNVGKKGKKGFFGLFKKDDDDMDDLIISEPTNFRHASSIGWDPVNGFQINNIPPEWRRLFQSAGIKKSDLKNQTTAAFVMKTIEENGGFDAPPAAPRPPPPPGGRPPAPPGGAPPPPPGGAPPPPPNAPAPPPPPAMGGDAPPAPPRPGGGGGRSNLLESIQQGATLRKVQHTTGAEAPAPPPTQGLAATLASAMNQRRMNIREDAEEGGEDSDWSDWEE